MSLSAHLFEQASSAAAAGSVDTQCVKHAAPVAVDPDEEELVVVVVVVLPEELLEELVFGAVVGAFVGVVGAESSSSSPTEEADVVFFFDVALLFEDVESSSSPLLGRDATSGSPQPTDIPAHANAAAKQRAARAMVFMARQG